MVIGNHLGTAAKRRQRLKVHPWCFEKNSALKLNIVSLNEPNVFLLECCRFVKLTLILDVPICCRRFAARFVWHI